MGAIRWNSTRNCYHPFRGGDCKQENDTSVHRVDVANGWDIRWAGVALDQTRDAALPAREGARRESGSSGPTRSLHEEGHAPGRFKKIIRLFHQNGLKLLFEDPHNVHDLLDLTGLEILDLIDFDRMTLDPTTYVQRDYRHVEADLVLRAPLRGFGGKRRITIYMLLERQSKPDPFMMLRVLDYVLQIYKARSGPGNNSILPARACVSIPCCPWSRTPASVRGLPWHPCSTWSRWASCSAT